MQELERRNESALVKEIKRRVEKLSADSAGVDVVRAFDPRFEKSVDSLVLSLVSRPVDVHVVTLCKQFRADFLLGASKLVGKQIADEIRTQDPSTVEVEYFMRRQECEA